MALHLRKGIQECQGVLCLKDFEAGDCAIDDLREDVVITVIVGRGRCLLGQDSYSGQLFPLQKFQGGAAASATVADLALRVVLLAARRRVTATNNGGRASLRGCDDFVHQRLRSSFKSLHLKDAHGPVPDDGLCLLDRFLVQRLRLASAVQAHETIRNSLILGHCLDLTILAKLAGDDKVDGQNNFHALLLRLLHDFRYDLRTFLIEQ
mmetsp:Transcript_55413/g.130051  ORF Transcript_55413/g.130051 Transcript_55413/m.130051 type:complete len:208 (-) Transcript_55413:735-1358(-)